MRFRPFVIILLTFSCFTAIYPQYYDTGEDPASLKWQQIKTGRFKIIYPENYGKEALNFAASLDKSFTKLSSFYSIKKTRFPVVIHNYTVNSNGYVAWAPKRMEIYPTPEQSSIPLDPVEQLTLHELTHVMQMYSLKKGFSRFLSLLAGEQAYGLASGLIPMWFMEGDAVLSESALSPSGRGRTPYFQKQMKALVTEKDKLFSYDKMLLDSYKNYIPDHYQLGYQMVSWLQSKYGHSVWNKALDYTARFPFLIYPVSLSNIKNTGLSNSRLYSQTYDTLKNIWNREMPASGPGTGEIINRSKRKDYINYPFLTVHDSTPPSSLFLYLSRFHHLQSRRRRCSRG